MASVSEIQKVEQLASELLKNRMASSRDDALRRAQDILQVKLGPKVHPVNMTMVTEEEYQGNSTPVPSVNAQGLPMSNDSNKNNSTGGDQKMHGFPEQHKSSISNQAVNTSNLATKEDVEKLRKDMNSGLMKLYEELKKSLDENHSSIKQVLLGSQPRSRPVQTSQPQSQNEEVERITIDEKPVEKKEEVHVEQPERTRELTKEESSRPTSTARKPRTGEFKPGDDQISVGNVFYFGNK